MDGMALFITPDDLYARLGTDSAPVLLDVRRQPDFDADDSLIISAMHHPPQEVEHWRAHLSLGIPLVVYCAHGGEVSQGVAEALRNVGFKAAYLEGGMAGWAERYLPTRKKSNAAADRWVTREHPKIDRIACPWLIRRFLNPLAEFLYVPASDVLSKAESTNAIPYDIKGVEFGHHGDRCSFDAIIDAFEIKDSALDHLATIVRGADTSRPDLTPQCEGLLAISYGLSANFTDDHAMLKHGMIIYDALYTWCRRTQAEQPRSVPPKL